MNYNKNVVVFTLVFTFILLAYSLLAVFFPSYSLGLDNINIVADVLKPARIDSAKFVDTTQIPGTTVAGVDQPLAPRDINMYLKRKVVTAFYTDSSLCALPALMSKLDQLKKTGKGKVRIAWLGDSFIEGDQLTKTVRQRLQAYFGGSGVGFVPVTSVTVDGFRSTISQKWSGDWVEENFKNKETSAPLFLSGRVYHAGNGSMVVKDLTLGKDSTQRLEKSLICGHVAGQFSVTANGVARQVSAPGRFNRIVLDSSTGHSIELSVANNAVPVYGISMEPKNGVVVDNFSFRGISGEELGRLDTTFLQAVQQTNSYDLVVLEYGVNVLYRPDNTDFKWHQRNMMKVLAKLRAAMPGVEFLIISTSDRGFRYGEVAKSAVGIDNLVKTQAELAYTNGMAFFNMFASMGGAGTIVRWADSTPVLAGHDYVHPNGRGAEILGNIFYDAFMQDLGKVGNKPKAVTNTAPAAVVQPTVATPATTPTVAAVPVAGYKTTSYGTIIDKRTGLEWMVAGDKDYTWPEAIRWADSMKADNAVWKLPTADQLLTLYDTTVTAGQGYLHTDGKTYPAHINKAFGKIGHGAWVWTSYDIDSAKALTVNLSVGKRVKTAKKGAAYPVRVFVVRKTEKSSK
jgi:lysophospholipase L1-like esterase